MSPLNRQGRTRTIDKAISTTSISTTSTAAFGYLADTIFVAIASIATAISAAYAIAAIAPTATAAASVAAVAAMAAAAAAPAGSRRPHRSQGITTGSRHPHLLTAPREVLLHATGTAASRRARGQATYPDF